jgi:hypothetical protein
MGWRLAVQALTFAGSYQDQHGREAVVWRIESTDRYRLPALDFATTIRGIEVRGPDFDALEPAVAAVGVDRLPLNSAGELSDCILGGDLPCTVDAGDRRRPGTITFSLDLRPQDSRSPRAPQHLHLSLALAGVTYEVTDEWFEEGVQRLEAALPAGTTLVCCVTCLYSDYSPGGHGLTGIRCHRGATEQYLAVRKKADYWGVPVTEEVPETYLCSEYQRRIPGTGYRG